MHASTTGGGGETNAVPDNIWKYERNNDTHNAEQNSSSNQKEITVP
jgi:hypothetical protein